jgi:hypothetical protein
VFSQLLLFKRFSLVTMRTQLVLALLCFIAVQSVHSSFFGITQDFAKRIIGYDKVERLLLLHIDLNLPFEDFTRDKMQTIVLHLLVFPKERLGKYLPQQELLSEYLTRVSEIEPFNATAHCGNCNAALSECLQG